jgi:hypothetical protein
MIWIGEKIPIWIERFENFRMMELECLFYINAEFWMNYGIG